MESVACDIGLMALVIVMDAHVHNIIAPGTYNTRLNKTLKENNMLPIILPNEKTESQNLIHTNIISEEEETEDIRKEQDEEEQMSQQEMPDLE